jgi:hypothetical protein
MADGVFQLSVPRIVRCTHPDYLDYSYDFGPFWGGGNDEIAGPGKRGWKGAFRGRPALAEALWPAICDALIGRKPAQFVGSATALRAFFRFLEKYEGLGFAPVDRLEDVTIAMSVLWLTPIDSAWEPMRDRKAYEAVGNLLRTARRQRFDQETVWDWHPYPAADITYSKDLPTETQTREAFHLLKREVRATFARWARADALAIVGRNLLEIPRRANFEGAFSFEPTEADAHATYRALIERTGDPLPTVYDLRRVLGLDETRTDMPKWWPRHGTGHPREGKSMTIRDLQDGLYPSIDDVDCLAVLFTARSGWNPSTVSDLDISNPSWARPHGDMNAGLYLIESWKERSKAWQWTLSQAKTSTGAYAIVSTLLQRGAPLRELVERDASRCDKPAIALRSPWVAASSGTQGQVMVRHSDAQGEQSGYWKALVRRHNASTPPQKHIPETMTPSDWRDLYANYVFLDSRYSWVMVQWALGHKHMASTRHYLRNLLWRRYSEKKLAEVVTLTLEGIEAHGRFDVVVIRAKVEFDYVPTVADLARVEKHREVMHERELTYTGYRCTNRFHPPKEIDPGNPSDGTKACRRGDRCPGCPLAQAIDSLHMSKRVAELRWLRREVSATLWAESQYASDLDGLEADLTQWPADEVAAQIAHWDAEIQNGRHHVIRFGSKQ